MDIPSTCHLPYNVGDGNVDYPVVNGFDSKSGASEGLVERDCGGEDEVVLLPVEVRVRLVPQNKDDIG